MPDDPVILGRHEGKKHALVFSQGICEDSLLRPSKGLFIHEANSLNGFRPFLAN